MPALPERELSASVARWRGGAVAYLSAAADFVVSQVVDRTTGLHGLLRKSDFDH